jgi:hypothetical protein
MKTNTIFWLLSTLTTLAFGSAQANADLIPVGAHFSGKLTGAVVGDTAQITAQGSTPSPHHPVTAEATWAPSLAKILQLITGQIRQLSIAHGTYFANTEQGTLTGTLAGVISYAGPTQYRLDAQIEVTGGDGLFDGASGGGELRAIVNTVDRTFTAELNLKVTPVSD